LEFADFPVAAPPAWFASSCRNVAGFVSEAPFAVDILVPRVFGGDFFAALPVRGSPAGVRGLFPGLDAFLAT